MGEVDEFVLTAEDKENMRVFLRIVYQENPSVVNNWRMNDRVFEITMDMVEQMTECSNLMDFVPRPTDLAGARGGARYVKAILGSIAKRVVRNQGRLDREIYISCRYSMARNYRSLLEMAGNDI